MEFITDETYFSPENNLKYMGSTQFKAFMECESQALADVLGLTPKKSIDAFLAGQFVEAHFEGNLDLFQAQHPEMISSKGPSKGQLKSIFSNLYKSIERAESDEFFMSYMNNEHQTIKTGEIEGVPFKIKIDNYKPGEYINDLKVMKDFQTKYVLGDGHLSFIEAYGYDIQGAIYQAVEGNNLPFLINGITKETTPDIAVISIPQDRLDYCLEIVKHFAPRFQAIKNGLIPPISCGKCDHCKSVKKLSEIVDYREL